MSGILADGGTRIQKRLNTVSNVLGNVYSVIILLRDIYKYMQTTMNKVSESLYCLCFRHLKSIFKLTVKISPGSATIK